MSSEGQIDQIYINPPFNTGEYFKYPNEVKIGVKNHTDKWAKSLSKALFNVPHRHAVLTISNVLWSVVRENRFLLKVLMDAAINDTISVYV